MVVACIIFTPLEAIQNSQLLKLPQFGIKIDVTLSKVCTVHQTFFMKIV